MLKKKILVTTLVLGIAGAGLLTTTHAFAQGDTKDASLVQMIADKFHLNKTDVQGVFDTYRQDNQAKRESQYESMLTQDVKDGKITDAQKTLILNKHKELVSQRLADKSKLKSMSATDRKAYLQQQKQQLTDWAKHNGIDLKYLFGGHRGFGRRGPPPGP